MITRLAGATLAAVALLCGPPAQAVFRLYLAADGDDARDGRSAATAIRTLARANRLLQAHAPREDIEIRIAPGTYRGQQVLWTYLNGHRISFLPTPGAGARPVFDGGGSAGTWFELRSAAGASKLQFRYLTVTNYWLGIDLVGDRNDLAGGWNGYNEVRNLRFVRIGGRYGAGPAPYSYAAVRLINSRYNGLYDNHFESIENPGEYSGYLHAIYLAHGASANRIERNRFVAVNGDAIRTRDGADANRMADNVFDRAGKRAAYSDWYCIERCTLPRPECPSAGNVFRDNRVGDGYYGAVSSTLLFGADDACGALAEPRLIESGTVRD
ncbi:right-handed parallel beta-helix repeat-containing protein [Lysobacter firmicutimachus]|uniref:Right-handed parallel beta-helix repeat-containing protein n=1 Tax=Lysobacter firmicutimachus TaxID=1792846 RepID=A0AAU8MU55_9GAMM